MKAVFFGCVTILLLTGLVVLVRVLAGRNVPVSLFSPTPVVEGRNDTGHTMTRNNIQYRVYLQKIANPGRLRLIPNFSGKKSSRMLMEENSCLYGVNAGFYTQNDQPLGIFYVDGAYRNATRHQNTLFNGFAYQTQEGRLHITNEPLKFEQGDPGFLFQSGPLFTPEMRLTIRNDEPARRVLLAKTEEGEYYFLAIAESDNSNSGPYLADLPSIVKQFNQLSLLPFPFSTLLNLDGGAASAFYTEEGVRLEELTPTGSFLCGN